jgi:peroxiredoxin-like protein
MSEQFYYETRVEWAGEKRGRLGAPGLPDVAVATPPEFRGHGGVWSPEHLFVAAVNSCFMTTFLAVAEASRLDFAAFSADATGKLEKQEGQGYAVTEVVVRPRLTVRRAQDAARAARILEKAERHCLISNSVRSAVRVEPVVEVAEAAEAAASA